MKRSESAKIALEAINNRWCYVNVSLDRRPGCEYPEEATLRAATEWTAGQLHYSTVVQFCTYQEMRLFARYLMHTADEWEQAEVALGEWTTAEQAPDGAHVTVAGHGGRVFTIHSVPGTVDYVLVAEGRVQDSITGLAQVRIQPVQS